MAKEFCIRHSLPINKWVENPNMSLTTDKWFEYPNMSLTTTKWFECRNMSLTTGKWSEYPNMSLQTNKTLLLVIYLLVRDKHPNLLDCLLFLT